MFLPPLISKINIAYASISVSIQSANRWEDISAMLKAKQMKNSQSLVDFHELDKTNMASKKAENKEAPNALNKIK